MLKLKTILAPVDFSSRTDAEAENAVNIARHFGSRLIFLHVIPRFADVHPTDPAAVEAYAHQFSAEIQKGVEGALDSLIERVASGIEVERVVLFGNPAEKIEEVAESKGVDLVVMPTAGRGRLRRRLLGSVTTRVLHDVACPVFTGVHLQEVDPAAKTLYKRIVCKMDLGEGADEVLAWTRDLAAAYDAELKAVCVLPFLDSWGATPSLPEPLREKALKEAHDRIEKLAAEKGAKAEVTVLGGPVERVLPPYLRETHADLLVTGRQRSQDVLGVFGQHRDIIDVVKCSPCPTILI